MLQQDEIWGGYYGPNSQTYRVGYIPGGLSSNQQRNQQRTCRVNDLQKQANLKKVLKLPKIVKLARLDYVKITRLIRNVQNEKSLYADGYRGIAITTEIDESIFDKNKKGKDSKKKNIENSNPLKSLPQPPDLSDLKAKFSKIHFYSRINIIISESGNIRKFTQDKNLKKYDLISFQPENQCVLKALTGIAEIDILSYNPVNKCLLSFNRKLYNQFVNQNVYFELIYAPAIADSSARRNLLSLSHIYRAIGKSKNIIVSSGAEIASYIRGPYDIINLNLLFGLSEEQSKVSVTRNCEKVLLRARKQRRNKSTVEMVRMQSSNEDTLMVNVPVEKENT